MCIACLRPENDEYSLTERLLLYLSATLSCTIGETVKAQITRTLLRVLTFQLHTSLLTLELAGDVDKFSVSKLCQDVNLHNYWYLYFNVPNYQDLCLS